MKNEIIEFVKDMFEIRLMRAVICIVVYILMVDGSTLLLSPENVAFLSLIYAVVGISPALKWIGKGIPIAEVAETKPMPTKRNVALTAATWFLSLGLGLYISTSWIASAILGICLVISIFAFAKVFVLIGQKGATAGAI